MKTLILITFIFIAVLADIDRWDLVSFSRTQESLARCLEERLGKTNFRNTLPKNSSQGFLWRRLVNILKTLPKNIGNSNPKKKYNIVECQSNRFYNKTVSAHTIYASALRNPLLDCSDPVITDSKTRYSLPRFIQEGSVGPLLDDILVQWLHKLPEMVSSKSHLELLMRFARDSLGDYERACEATSSTSLNEMLKIHWNHRAQLFFDGWVNDSYIRHVYTRDIPISHTFDNPRVFYKRRVDRLSDRNLMASPTDLKNLIQLYALRLAKPKRGYFLDYQRHGYNISDKLLEDSKIRFYQVILIFIELLVQKRVTINYISRRGIDIVSMDMPKIVEDIVHGGGRLHRYLVALRSYEISRASVHDEFRKRLEARGDSISMPDLIMLRWMRIQKITPITEPAYASKKGKGMFTKSKTTDKCFSVGHHIILD